MSQEDQRASEGAHHDSQKPELVSKNFYSYRSPRIIPACMFFSFYLCKGRSWTPLVALKRLIFMQQPALPSSMCFSDQREVIPDNLWKMKKSRTIFTVVVNIWSLVLDGSEIPLKGKFTTLSSDYRLERPTVPQHGLLSFSEEEQAPYSIFLQWLQKEISF